MKCVCVRKYRHADTHIKTRYQLEGVCSVVSGGTCDAPVGCLFNNLACLNLCTA